jgi:hypothetical protein
LRRVRFSNHPTYDASEKVIAYFSTVGEVYFFQLFGVVGHFQDGVGADIPHAFHPPAVDIAPTLRRQSSESLICDVKTVAYINSLSTPADKRADIVDEGFVGYLAVVEGQIDNLADVWGRGEEFGPVEGDRAEAHQLVDVEVGEDHDEDSIR